MSLWDKVRSLAEARSGDDEPCSGLSYEDLRALLAEHNRLVVYSANIYRLVSFTEAYAKSCGWKPGEEHSPECGPCQARVFINLMDSGFFRR